MEAVFPLIRTGNRSRYAEICGTAFFYAPQRFLTCAHTFEFDPDATYLAALNLQNLLDVIPIEWTADRTLDVAIGRIDLNHEHPLLQIAIDFPAIGTKLKAMGFIGRRHIEANGRVNSSRIHRSEASCNFLGAANFKSSEIGPIAAKDFYAVITDGPIPIGFSGGPILNAHSEVVALHSNTHSGGDGAESVNAGKPFCLNPTFSHLREMTTRLSRAES